MKIIFSILSSLLLLIGLAVAGFFLLKFFRGPEMIASVKQEAVTAAYSSLNSCGKDDDCILSDIKPYCGCYYLINKHVPSDDLAKAEEAYRNSGEKCRVDIECQQPPEQDQIKCVSGKCTSVRPTDDPEKTFSSDPEILEKQIKNNLYNANYCATDDNCIVADIDATCPFDCYNLVSRNADLTWIKQGISKYNDIVKERCIYDCDRKPTAKEIKCVKNKCIDSRYPGK